MGLGVSEVVLILVVGLIIFGPRKLPELGKSLGQAMSQFRRASEDFKRTWEQEVESDKTRTSDHSTASTGYNYESSDSYNPYAGDPGTAQLPEASSEAGVESDAPKPEPVAAATSEKKHWI